MITLAIDGMGGDGAPQSVIEGLALVAQGDSSVRFLVYGDERALGPLIASRGELTSCVELRHTDEFVTADTKPSTAVRGLKRSSMRLALEAVAQGEAQCVVSAGNTGAYLALSKLVLKTLPGIDRPAIISQFPTQRGESVVLDLGANVTCSARNLVEFALMGETFARHVLGIENPTIGILNVGSESGKGTPYLTDALNLLERSLEESHGRVHGFIEGDDIAKGTVDVVVTDGFTGNVALKTAEGMTRLMFQSIQTYMQQSLWSRLSCLLAMPLIKKLKQSFDPRQYNGAMWLGVNGIAVKSHGGTDAAGFAQAVLRTVAIVQADLNTCIAKELEYLGSFQEP